jgi:putative hemolysin
MLTEALLIVGLILVNGIFSGAEIAVVAMRRSRVRELAESGSQAGLALDALRHDPERFLSTVQIGITVVGAAAAALGGASFAEHLEPLFARVPLLAPRASELALVVVVLLVSYFSIVLGELVPKSLALRTSEGYATLVARPLLWLSGVVKPAVWLLTRSSNAFLRIFGDRTTFTEARLSIEELRTLVDEARAGGSVPPEAGAIATRVLESADLTAADVMIHRRFVEALPLDAGPELVRAAFERSGHQRYPVYEGSLDNVVGYVSWHDVLARLWSGQALELSGMIRPCHFTPETVSALRLIQELRERRIHIAVAVDEHGGMAGIVTMEDLVEELVGDIVSERTKASQPLVRDPDGSFLAQALVPIRDVNRELGIELEEPERLSTLGGLCLHLAGGRIPRVGERFVSRDGTSIEVVDASPRRIRAVRLRKAGSPAAKPAGGGAQGLGSRPRKR